MQLGFLLWIAASITQTIMFCSNPKYQKVAKVLTPDINEAIVIFMYVFS